MVPWKSINGGPASPARSPPPFATDAPGVPAQSICGQPAPADSGFPPMNQRSQAMVVWFSRLGRMIQSNWVWV